MKDRYWEEQGKEIKIKNAIKELAESWEEPLDDKKHEVCINIECEALDLYDVVSSLCLDNTVWEGTRFKVDGYKDYDEDLNSYWVILLIFDATGKTKEEMYLLARVWEEVTARYCWKVSVMRIR